MMYDVMHRTQILLEQWQYDTLRSLAERRGTSLSALVRAILTEHLEEDARRAERRLSQIEGIAEGPADLGRDHDRYLYGKRKRPRR